jgi:TolB protein
MDANGGAQQPIAESKHNDNFADWSPDNTMIAFVSDRGGDEDVWVMAADGSGARNVSHNPGRDIHPFWTPDGGSILFNSTRATANEHFDVYSMAPDGSDLTVVRADADEKTCARRSPTAARIVYLKGAENDEIYAMNADGSGDTNLTKSDAAEGWPTWTPDGRRIVFSSRRDGRFALCVMDADGSRVRQISFPPEGSYDARPNISADGSKIVFNRQTGRTIAIYVMPMPPTRS